MNAQLDDGQILVAHEVWKLFTRVDSTRIERIPVANFVHVIKFATYYAELSVEEALKFDDMASLLTARPQIAITIQSLLPTFELAEMCKLLEAARLLGFTPLHKVCLHYVCNKISSLEPQQITEMLVPANN